MEAGVVAAMAVLVAQISVVPAQPRQWRSWDLEPGSCSLCVQFPSGLEGGCSPYDWAHPTPGCLT